MVENKPKHLLEVVDLYTSFNIPAGEVRSVNGVTFSVDKGKVLGIVGESGSGKSVTAYSIMQILQHPGRIVSGSVKFNGKELLGLPSHQLQKIRGEKISIIFQDPMSSLNPVYTVGNQMREAINLHPVKRIVDELDKNVKITKRAYVLAKENKLKDIKQKKEAYEYAVYKRKNYANDRALEMLKLVGINEPEKRLKQYPFEFSGGMLQRIMIAMSLVCEPDLLIADEPTTALDVTIQAQILELLKDLQKKMGMGIIIITHDLGVVAQICDEIDVMYAGRIVERGDVNEIFYNPKHEYTKGLLKSIPQANDTREKLVPIEGNPVDVFCLPKGCSFAPRCASCMKICLKKYPQRVSVNERHQTSCFKYILEAYKEKKFTKEEFDNIISLSRVGNAAFKPISEIDVLDAYNDSVLAKRMYKHVALETQALSKDEQEQIYYRMKEMHNNYVRAKKDLKLASRNRKLSRKNLPSMERGDMARHIKEAKTRVKYVNDMFANKQNLYEHLEHLPITSYSVDYNFHRESVAAKKLAYDKAKLALKKIDSKDRVAKARQLCEIDAKKKEYENAQDKYARNRRVTRKLLKTREQLIKLNAKRVKNVIKTNAKNALKEFKQLHLMFTKKQELDNYLNGFIYAHWDFDSTITRREVIAQYYDWQRKQRAIENARKNNKDVNINKLIKDKNLAMYRYWFNRYDRKIAKYYRMVKRNFEQQIRRLNTINHKRSRVIYRAGGSH